MKTKILMLARLALLLSLCGAISACSTVRGWFFTDDELDEGALIVIESESEDAASDQSDASGSDGAAPEFSGNPDRDLTGFSDASGQYRRDDALYDPLGYGDNYILRESGDIVLMPTVREVSIDTSQVERLLYRSAQHIEDARRFFYAGQYDEALFEVNAALELTPRSPTAYSIKGSIEYKKANFAKARAAWSVALQLDPSLKGVEQMLALLDE